MNSLQVCLQLRVRKPLNQLQLESISIGKIKYRLIHFMKIQILKSKIQSVIVTESNIEYPGSISLSTELLKASGIKQFELVHVNNKTNGHRIVTYAVKNNQKGRVTINGAASKFFQKGDNIHVLAFALINESEADMFQPTLVLTDIENNVIECKPYTIE